VAVSTSLQCTECFDASGTDTINTTPTPGSFFNLPAELRNAVHELIFDVTPHHYLER